MSELVNQMNYVKKLKEEMLKDKEALNVILLNLEVDNILLATEKTVERLHDLESFIEADMKRLMS